MRKLFVGGIVFVLTLVMWKLYLDYETKQFIQKLSQPPSQVQQLDGTTKVTTVTSGEEVNNTVHEPLESAPRLSATETSADSERPIQTDTAAIFEVGSLSPGQEPDEIGLSPAVETLFSEFAALYEESLVVGKVFAPLTDQTVAASRRQTEIGQKLSATTDNAKIRALYAESEEISAWFKEIKPTYIELRDELRRIQDARDTLLEEYGFASEEEFRDNHWEAYKAWRAVR